MATAKLQDMPPPGGYGPIQIDKVPLRRIMTFKRFAMIYPFMLTVGFCDYKRRLSIKERTRIELLSAKNVITALVYAETDRLYLKTINRNRELERELMKDVEGWEVGTYYGEPRFLTVPDTKFMNPHWHEYWAHYNPDTYYERLYRANWH